MPTLIGGLERVVEFDGLSIDELAGNVATKDDRISIALVKVQAFRARKEMRAAVERFLSREERL